MKKALYKQILKNIASKKKGIASKVAQDILDDNYEAQVDPDLIPHEQENVVNKSKGVKKLKSFVRKQKYKNKKKNNGNL